MTNNAPLELLASQLAELDERTAASGAPAIGDATVASLKAELDTFVAELRQPPAPSEYENESTCQRVTEMVQAIGRDPDDLTDKTTDSFADTGKPSATAETPLGTLGVYELLTKLGEGGMGAVYKARHTKLDKIVAIKVLPAERMKDKGAVARFEREMRAVGKLEHPNIVRAMDAGEAAGTHYLVMEYVQGLDLSQLAKGSGPLPIADACELIRQAAVGLEEARENGMVHRDIKPSNIMLCVASGRRKPPVVKVLDMGLALLSEAHSADAQGLTNTGQMMGTLDYMAPEQGGDSHDVDIRADIYSLGASLYKLLCGEAIYFGPQYQTPVQKMMALATQPAPPIQKRRQGVPSELAAVLHRMLEKHPAKRFATPEEVAQALAPFCAGANLAALLNSAGFDIAPTPDTAQSKTEPSLSQPETDTGVSKPAPPALKSATGGLFTSAAAAKAKPPVASAEKTNPAFAKAPAPKPAPTPARVDKPPVPAGIQSLSPAPHIQPQPVRATVQVKKPATRKALPWLPIAIGGGLLGLAGILALATVFFLQTKNGTLRVEINDPSIEVTIKGTDIVLKQADNKEITLTPGEHTLTIKRGDFSFDTRNFDLKQGETTTVKVELLAGKLQVAANGQILGEREPGAPLATTVAVATKPGMTAASENFALEFDGKTSLVHIPSLSWDGTRRFTVEAWIASPPDPGGVNIITIDGVSRYQLFRQGTLWAGGTFKEKKPWIDAIYFEADRNFHNRFSHVAYVVDGTTYRIFENGKLLGKQDFDTFEYKRPFDPRGTIGGGWNRSYMFRGRVDEVRISSIPRYTEKFTPAKRFEPDADTIALYHCDEGTGDLLHDSSGHNHHGEIVGAKWVRAEDAAATGTPSTKLVAALEFDGVDDFVALPDLPYDKIEPITFEAWVTPSAETKKPSAEPIVWGNGAWTLMHTEKDWRHFRAMMVGSQRNAKLGRRDHVAAVWDGKEPRLYVNGVRGGVGGKLQGPNVHLPRTLGAMGGQNGVGAGRWFHGAIDEVRISKGVRYNDNFTPTESLAADPNTIALYHFDEGEGDVLRDSSGNNYHGKIGGAKWVKLESSASPTTGGSDSPAGKFALKFDRGNKAIAEKVPYLKSVPITIEAWATLEPCLDNPNAQPIVSTGNGYLAVYRDGFSFYTFHGGPFRLGAILPKRRVHIAGVNDGKMRRLYLNGKLIAKINEAGELDGKIAVQDNPLFPLTIGSDRLEAVIDAVRVSRTARYDKDFTPPVEFTKEDDTFALYLFNEGQGDTLHDSSGNGYDAKITGAKWVQLEGDRTPRSDGDNALRISDQDGSMAQARFAYNPDQPLTIEGYFKVNPAKVDDVNGLLAALPQLQLQISHSSYVVAGHGVVGGDQRFRPGEWVHLAGVASDKALRLFVDGKRVATVPRTASDKIADEQGPLMLGHNMPGEFDEVRVSQAARYDADFTPARRFEPDNKTLALYHCDETAGDVLHDASGRGNDAAITGGTWVSRSANVQPTAPATNSALEFDGKTSIVNIPSLSWDGKPRFTVEAWIAAPSSKDGVNIITVNGVSRYQLFRMDSWWAGGMGRKGGIDQIVFPADKKFYDRMVHVAYVVDGKTSRLFENGKQITKGEFSTPEYKFSEVGKEGTTIGGLTKGWFMFRGTIDEIRVSSVPRYADKFTPASRFEPDADTIALYHCDEGAGDVLRDSSGNKHDGKIVGAKWITLASTASSLRPTPGNWLPLLDDETQFSRWVIKDAARNHVSFADGELKISAAKAPEKFMTLPVAAENFVIHWEHFKSGFTSAVRMRIGEFSYGNSHFDVHQLWRHQTGEASKQLRIVADSSGQGKDRWGTFDFVVVDGTVTFYVEGKKLYSHPIESTKLTEIALSARDSNCRWRNLAIMPLTTEQIAAVREGQLPKFQREIDLLEPLDPIAMTDSQMKWERVGDHVVGKGLGPAGESTWKGFHFPTEVSGDYEVEIEFLQRGFYPVQFDMPLTDTAVRISLAPNGCYLYDLGPKSTVPIYPGVAHTLVARVRQEGANAEIAVTLDGADIGTFAGERSKVKIPHWLKPDTKHVRKGSLCDLGKAHFELRRAVYRPLPPAETIDIQ